MSTNNSLIARVKLNGSKNDLIEIQLSLDKLFEQQRIVKAEHDRSIFEILKEEKILSQSIWNSCGSGSRFNAKLAHNDFTKLNELIKFDDDIQYENIQLSCYDGEIKLYFDNPLDIPSFVKEHNLIINSDAFIVERDSLKSRLESVEEIIKLLGI